ncbi:MAG: DUF3572 family protein [Paracoccus sp. (in: a-proteobacteria)]|uniref:DUF3572 family protein n=1 Tax=Paracoccus sp. TaxID=267 RepID=UPI0026DF54F7|nr:DUF3572 family protein [Paracoccus sp. (in: a-proteobacteria)]MDO5622063.1 DUF3572 family protein [Paracoccus sp. (in: a-proteobacteria)]
MMTQAAARDLAEQAFLYLTEDPDSLVGFMAASGLAPSELRNALQQPGFHESVLDFLMLSDSQAEGFLHQQSLPADALRAAHAALSGGVYEW